MKLLLILTGCIFFAFSQAQPIPLTSDIEEVTLAGHCYTYEDTTNQVTYREVLNVDWTYFGESGPKFGYAKHIHWLKFDLVNNEKTPLDRNIFLPYNHLKLVEMYLLKGDSLIKYNGLGTVKNYKDKKIETRGYPFSISINPADTLTVLLRLDNRSIPLRASTFIVTNQRLQEIIVSSEGMISFWRGVFIFTIVICFLLYLSIKLRLFLYYCLFTLNIMLFIGTEIGDFYYFFDEDPNNYISDLKHVFNYLAIFFLPLFINELTPIKKFNKWSWQLMYWTSYPLACLVPLGFLPGIKNSSFYMVIDIYMLSWAMFVLFFLLALLLRVSIKKQKNAGILLGLYSFYIGVLCISIILPAIGLKSESPLVNNELLLGGILEVFTFMILIGRESIGIYKDRATLSEKQKYHQREMLTAIVESQEKERNRVGRELHDMVGANMSVIKQNIPAENKSLRKVVSSTIESVRGLSHGLVTPRIKGDEFVDEVTELCVVASNGELKINPYFHNWEKIENPEFTTNLFRIIQELIQNAIKHSRANKAHIQLIKESNELLLMYDDDGVGFNFDDSRKIGAGLKGIENRVELINGKLEVSRGFRKKGTSINITIPI